MQLRKKVEHVRKTQIPCHWRSDEEKAGQWNYSLMHGNRQSWKWHVALCQFTLAKSLFCLSVCCCVTMTIRFYTHDRAQEPHRCCPNNHCPRHISSALGCSGCSCMQIPQAGTGVEERRRGWLEMGSGVGKKNRKLKLGTKLQKKTCVLSWVSS